MRIIWEPGYLINLKLQNNLYTIAQLEVISLCVF